MVDDTGSQGPLLAKRSRDAGFSQRSGSSGIGESTAAWRARISAPSASVEPAATRSGARGSSSTPPVSSSTSNTITNNNNNNNDNDNAAASSQVSADASGVMVDTDTDIDTNTVIMDTNPPSSSRLSLSSSARGNSNQEQEASIEQISERLRGIALPMPPPLSLPEAAPARLVDYRFKMQAPKIEFITRKRCDALWRVGLGLRLEPAHTTIQDFLDKTVLARSGGGGDGCGNGYRDVDPEGDNSERVFSVGRTLARGGVGGGSGEEGRSDGGGGRAGGEVGGVGRQAGSGEVERAGAAAGGSEAGEMSDRLLLRFQDMSLVYCPPGGWVYLHHVTEEAARVFREIIEEICFEELGIPSTPPLSSDSLVALEGMVDILNESSNVRINVEGAIVNVAGTREAVGKASRAILAVTRSNERVCTSSGYWYWRGDEEKGLTPVYAMTHEINALLDQAYLVFLSSGLSFAAYSIVGVPYKVDFTQMLQTNLQTGFKRPVERLVTLRPEPPVARCPSDKISLSSFREGTTYTVVRATQEEESKVKDAVRQSYAREVAKVEHIWNSFLWGHYAQNGKSIGNEKMLFHGASSKAIDQICRTGFDRRLAGSANGAAFGRGCYFARDASYAARYMEKDSGSQMVMAKVLVGECCPGAADMVRPPKLWPTGERTFDSTADRASSPKIIVTYKDWQAYPMYIITFRPLSRRF